MQRQESTKHDQEAWNAIDTEDFLRKVCQQTMVKSTMQMLLRCVARVGLLSAGASLVMLLARLIRGMQERRRTGLVCDQHLWQVPGGTCLHNRYNPLLLKVHIGSCIKNGQMIICGNASKTPKFQCMSLKRLSWILKIKTLPTRFFNLMHSWISCNKVRGPDFCTTDLSTLKGRNPQVWKYWR